MKSVFVLHHVNPSEIGSDDGKLIGVYRTETEARNAIRRLQNLPGFRDHPDLWDPSSDGEQKGFTLDEYELDQDNWIEGFG